MNDFRINALFWVCVVFALAFIRWVRNIERRIETLENRSRAVDDRDEPEDGTYAEYKQRYGK